MSFFIFSCVDVYQRVRFIIPIIPGVYLIEGLIIGLCMPLGLILSVSHWPDYYDRAAFLSAAPC
jgi:hypothetical protein